MKDDIETRQKAKIEAARLASGAVRVRLHHVPGWLAPRLRRATSYFSRRGGYGSHAALSEFIGQYRDLMLGSHGRLLDHWGTSERGNVFVSEPYEDVEAQARRFAELLGLALTVSSTSWWYPGWTKRYEWRRPQ